MSLIIAFMKRTLVCLIALALVYVVPSLANPNNYPQFAQQQVDPAIPIFFTGVEYLKAQLDAGKTPMLVDVRSAEEYKAGHIPGARNLPRGQLELRVDDEIPDPTMRIVTCCEFGKISTLAAAMLRTLGYTRAVALDGGVRAWREAGYPLEATAPS